MAVLISSRDDRRVTTRLTSRLASRLRRWFESGPERLSGVVAAGLVGLAVAIAASILPPLLVAIGIAAALVTPLLIRFPLIGLVTILVFYTTVFDIDTLPGLPIGIGMLNPMDLILLLSLLVVANRSRAGEATAGFDAVDLSIFAFLGFLVLSTAVGFDKGVTDLGIATNAIRNSGYYLCYVAVAHLFSSWREVQRVLQIIVVLAVLVSIAMMVQLVVGDSIRIVNGRVEEFPLPSATPTTRIIPSGRYLVLIAFWLLTAMGTLAPTVRSWWYRLAWPITGIAVVLTLFRAFILTSAMVFVIMLVVAEPDARRRLLRRFGTGAVSALLVFGLILVGPEGPVKRSAVSFVERVASITDSGTYGDEISASGRGLSSLEFRRVENQYAAEYLTPPSLLGLGAGAVYRPYDNRIDSEEFIDGDRFIHNGHFWLLIKAGALGYAALMIAYALVTRRGWQVWRRAPLAEQRAVGLVFALALPAMLLKSIVDPIVVDFAWAPLFGVVAGTITVLHRLCDSTGDSDIDIDIDSDSGSDAVTDTDGSPTGPVRLRSVPTGEWVANGSGNAPGTETTWP